MIVSKPPSKEYTENFDKIFRSKPKENDMSMAKGKGKGKGKGGGGKKC